MLTLLVAVCGVILPSDADEAVVEGTCPAISRDGRSLAFQRVEGNNIHLGILELAGGKVRWLVRGETPETRNENACHPSWGPDGKLAFAYANLTNTAYARFHAGGLKDGYRLRVWEPKENAMRDLVGGLSRNYNPSFSPDGDKIYFCKQGGKGKRANDDFRRQAVAVVDVADPSDPLPVVKAPPGELTCGVSQPVVSPNGKFLAFAEVGRTDALWGVKIARVDRPDEQLALSPGHQAAYAPNWFPDGKRLVYTGFAVGDPGWCVYVIDVETGVSKRLCPGEDACVAPDGKTLYFARGGKIWKRALGPADLPQADVPAADPGSQPERVLFRSETTVTNRLYASAEARHDCTSNTVHFIRYTLDWDGRGTGFPFAGGFGPLGVWSFVIDKCPTALGRESGNIYNAAAAVDVPFAKGEHRMTVIFASGVVYHSADGSPAIPRAGNISRAPCGGEKCNYAYFPNGALGNGVAVRNLEMGVGWPKDVPAPLTGKEVAE